MSRTVYIASDHAGFELKKTLTSFLNEKGCQVIDMGPDSYDPGDDYPYYIDKVAEVISTHPERATGIVLGGSGQGEAMAANRFPFVRAAVYYGGNKEIIELAREHNNANILSLGARFIKEEEAKEAVTLFLDGDFSGDDRHRRRLKEIEDFSKKIWLK